VIPQLSLKREDFPDLTGERIDRLLKSVSEWADGVTRAVNGVAPIYCEDVILAPKDEWKSITLAGAWTQGTPPVRYKRMDDIVEFEGFATRNAATSGSTVYTLPAGTWPSVLHRFPASGPSGTGVYIDVSTAGVVTISWTAPPSTVSLDSVSFSCGITGVTFGANPIFPYRFKNRLPGGQAPKAVWIVGGWDITNRPQDPVSMGTLSWRMAANGSEIEIIDIDDLPSGRKYRVRLAIMGG